MFTCTWLGVNGFGGAGGVGGGAGGVGAGGAGAVRHGVEPVHVMLICIGKASCKFLSMLSNLNDTPLQAQPNESDQGVANMTSSTQSTHLQPQPNE